MRDEPNFVASIAGASTNPSSPPAEPATMEQPITVPEAWSAAPQPPHRTVEADAADHRA